MGDYMDTAKKKTGILIDASKEVGLEVNTQKSKHVMLPCHQNAGQNHAKKTANRSFKYMAQFKYMGTRVTNQNFIYEGIKR
jgi:hypothetical protein